MKLQTKVKNIILLQAIVVLYTFAGVFAKFASSESLLSFRFFLFYGIEFIILLIYALFWQQLIKKFELSVAYANRAMGLLWSMLWSVILFKEGITIKKIIGVIIVIIGICIINTDKKSVTEKEGK